MHSSTISDNGLPDADNQFVLSKYNCLNSSIEQSAPDYRHATGWATNLIVVLR